MAEDYMSDAFLEELKDVRPGLLSREGKRKSKVERKSTQAIPKSKKIKVIEDEAREKGLAAPLSSDNKGFAMLQKMGYKEGTALGKSGEGQASPIPLVLKNGKTGLGRKAFVTEKKSEEKAQTAAKFSDFRSRKQASLSLGRAKFDLRKSQQSCQSLDTSHGIDAPVKRWFWPEEALPELDSDDSSDEAMEDMEPLEMLQSVTAYLRASYFYCVWCGTAYQDDDDLQVNCPGDSEEAHE